MKTPPALARLAERLDALSLRERMLVLGAAVAALFLLWDTLLMQPLRAQREAQETRLESLQQETTALETSLRARSAEVETDPDAAARQRLEQARVELAGVEQEIQELTGTLVDPEQVAHVLEALLARSEGIELVALESLGSQRIETDADAGEGYYRHRMAVELSGSYNAVLGYLRAIEQLPWRVYWDELRLEVDEYPVNRTRLVIYNLSPREGLLGV